MILDNLPDALLGDIEIRQLQRLGLEREFLAILEHLRANVPGFQRIEVGSYYYNSPDQGPHLVLNIYRVETPKNPPTMLGLSNWVANNLSADAAEWFVFGLNYEHDLVEDMVVVQEPPPSIRMTRIDPHTLWISSVLRASDLQHIFDREIRAVLELAVEEPAAPLPRDLVHLRFPLVDGKGNARELILLAANCLAGLIGQRIETLVCCSSGLSRSPSIAAGALCLKTKQSPDKCLELVSQFRRTDVSPALWSDVKAALQSLS